MSEAERAAILESQRAERECRTLRAALVRERARAAAFEQRAQQFEAVARRAYRSMAVWGGAVRADKPQP